MSGARHPDISDAEFVLEAARRSLADAVARVQSECGHEPVAECEYKADPYGPPGDPPRRVCLCCGVAEVGWGAGFRVLTGDRVYPMPRLDVYAHQRLVITQKDAVPEHVRKRSAEFESLSALRPTPAPRRRPGP